jgi:DNA-binding GntR family transcriptional regulator
MSQRVFAELERDILERRRPPGSRLIEDSIAAELGVSRTPVREAIRMLNRTGWVDSEPHAGAVVRNPGLDEIGDVFHVRELLERDAAELAAERADDQALDELSALVRRGKEDSREATLPTLVALNSEFHQAIARAGRSPLLQRFIEDLDKQARWLFAAVAVDRLSFSWAEHEAIVDAIAARRRDEAGRLSADHCRRSRDVYLEQLL